MLKIRLVFYFMLAGLSVQAQALLGVKDSKNAPEGDQLPNSTHANTGDELYNVDLYTGIGSTRIPIYDYQIDGLDLGVSLSYSNKGIRVDDVASSAGLGWEVQAGGSIDRLAQGLEDEFSIPNWDGLYILGPWVDSTISAHRDYATDIFIANLGGRTVKFAMQKYNGFAFTMPKSELKVYARHSSARIITDGVWPQYGTLPIDTTSFTIVDEKGNSFYFIQGDQNHRITEGATNSHSLYVTNKFVLWQVVTYTGKTIKFNYRRTNVDYALYKEEKVWERGGAGFVPEIKDVRFDGFISELSDIEYPNGVKVYFNTDDQNHARCDLPGAAVLSSIKVEGAYDNNIKHSITYRLNQSYFSTPNSTDTRTEVPHRTSCSELTINSLKGGSSLRLKLNSIDRLDANGNGERFFTFDYHPSPLPKRLSPQRDYYGYANNGHVFPLTTNNGDYNLSIPQHTIVVFVFGTPIAITYGTNRTPDTTTNLDYLQACILKKITNGQGGEIEFRYKKPVLANVDPLQIETYRGYNRENLIVPNTIDQDKSGRDATDGLVVYQVIKKDGISLQHTLLTQYDYSDGQRFHSGGYFWKPVLLENDQNSNNFLLRERQYFNFFLSPQPFFRGSNHGFSSVTTTVHNQYTSERLSKKIYQFSNLKVPTDLATLFDPSNIFTNPKFPGSANITQTTGLLYHTAYVLSFNTILMGLVMSEQEYDMNDQLVSSRVNKYHANGKYPDGLPHALAIQARDFIFNKPCPQPGCDTTVISTMGGREGGGEGMSNSIWRITNSTVTNYSGSTQSSIKYNYTYDFRDNVKAITWTDSKNETYRKEYDYTYDWNLCTHCNPDTMQHRIVERLVKVDVNNAANNKIIKTRLKVPHPYTEKNLTLFPYPNRDNKKPDFLAYSKKICQLRFPNEYETFTNAPILYDSNYRLSEERALGLWSGSLPSFERTKQFTIYDSSGNVLETRLRNRQIYTACVWDSVADRKIAEISNAKFNQIAYTGFEGLTHSASDLSRGNWVFSPSRVKAPTGSSNSSRAIAGRYIYETQSQSDSIITTYALEAGKEYRLSLWATRLPYVFLGNTDIGLGTEMQLQDGWTLYSRTIVGDGNRLKITQKFGTAALDELRLHPVDARMKTWSYIPLLGMTTAVDEFNNITYYEYDMQGRPTIVRDINGHIRSQQKQINQGFDN
ncbi:hypothetical protein [Pedobacter sp. UBA4863]|uniref:hypothetical protein n=1 Tax=Pedobacter sp. UBA4863 TaxID=1947060 RepID=UPI0025D2F8E2|nr:hypothetical protein [Pedobacter sp. UBA4863]